MWPSPPGDAHPQSFDVTGTKSIMGHGLGGHGERVVCLSALSCEKGICHNKRPNKQPMYIGCSALARTWPVIVWLPLLPSSFFFFFFFSLPIVTSVLHGIALRAPLLDTPLSRGYRGHGVRPKAPRPLRECVGTRSHLQPEVCRFQKPGDGG